MGVCAGITRAGERCKADATAGAEWCWSHDPAHADERRRRASRGGKRGGRGRPGSDLQDLKGEIRAVITDVLKGEVSTAPAAVALQGYNCLLRAEKLELDIREQTDLIERLEELESVLEHQKGDHRGYA
jgi:hypothetical protein